MKVRLDIPVEAMKSRSNGEHFSYNQREGVLIAAAGNDGAWVMFDAPKYVGCPLRWLKRV